MKTQRKPITPEQLRNWASGAQLKFLDAVMQCGAFKANELAFHGGTSLHLSWASPRFSEDLDFLVDKAAAQRLPAVIKAIERQMREMYVVEDPSMVLEIRNKTKDDSRLGNFHIVVSHPSVVGSVMVKAEFWMVDAHYLENYPTVFRTPMLAGDVVAKVSSPIPAAELATAYADKLTAFATRPFLKWRDLYDLWWLGTQTRAVPDPAGAETVKQFLHNLSGYKTPEGMTPGQALARFHTHDVDELAKQGEADLRRWLPARHWESLVAADGVRAIVRYVDQALKQVEAALPAHDAQLQGAQVQQTEEPVPSVATPKARRPRP